MASKRDAELLDANTTVALESVEYFRGSVHFGYDM